MSVLVCVVLCVFFFFFKQKTAYEMRISDWSSDVCSSDLRRRQRHAVVQPVLQGHEADGLIGGGIEPGEGGELAHRLIWIDAGEEELDDVDGQIGRASCRERVCQYV